MPRCPFAVFRGPIPNQTPGGMIHPVHGLVLHVEEGTETGTDGWFHNPTARASAHFGVGKDGTLHQWVDTDDKAWAEATGNPSWWSVETEGVHTEALTDPQIATLARLYDWLMGLPDRIPSVLAESPADRGFGWHGMGGQAWGGHLSCPGDLRRAQRADVLTRVVRPVPPTPGPIPPPLAPTEDEPMLIFWHANSAYLLAHGKLSYIAGSNDLNALKAAGAKEVPAVSDDEWGILERAYGPVVV